MQLLSFYHYSCYKKTYFEIHLFFYLFLLNVIYIIVEELP